MHKYAFQSCYLLICLLKDNAFAVRRCILFMAQHLLFPNAIQVCSLLFYVFFSYLINHFSHFVFIVIISLTFVCRGKICSLVCAAFHMQIPLLSYGWDRMGNGHVCSFCFFKQPYCLAWLYMYLNPPLCNDVPGMSMSIFLHLSASEFPNYHIHFSPLCCCLPTRMTTTAPRFSHCLPSTYTQSGAAVKVE